MTNPSVPSRSYRLGIGLNLRGSTLTLPVLLYNALNHEDARCGRCRRSDSSSARPLARPRRAVSSGIWNRFQRLSCDPRDLQLGKLSEVTYDRTTMGKLRKVGAA